MTRTSHSLPLLTFTALPALLLTAAMPAEAQAPARPQRPVLEEIVVTATRMETPLNQVPAAISVVSKEDIQLGRQQLALDESLSRVPGLFMQNRYNYAQDLRVSIRGFGARANFGIRGVKILVDGIPETLPDGQGSVDGIDLGAVEQIEVIRGPSSSLYGNASGGVISVTSEDPPEDPFAEVRLSGGRYDFQKLQLKAGGQGDRVGYLVSLSDSDYEGFREQSRAENRQLSGRFNFDFDGDRELLAVVNVTDQPVSDDPGGLTAELASTDPTSAWPGNVLFDAGEALEQQRLGFVYSMPLGSDRHTLTARNYYVWRDFSNSLPFVNGGIVEFDRFFAGGGLSYTYDGFWLDRPNRVIVGIDYDDQDDDRMRFNNDFGSRGALTFDQNESVNSRGLFVQNELSVTEDLLLTMGVRFDRVEFDVTDRFLSDGDDSGTRSLDGTSPMLGLVYTLSPNLNLYANYSSAFETPTTTEFNDPSGGGGFNPGLDPQEAQNLEVGLRGLIADRHRYEIALFSIEVDDELIPFEVPGSPGRDYYVNAGKSSRDGVEFSLIAQPTDRLQATLSYTYSDFTYDQFIDANGQDFGGNTIPGTSENVLFGELSYRDPRGWFGALDVLFIDEQFANNANTAVNDSYTLSNVRFGYEHTAGSLLVTPFVAVNNLFDETYNANVRINAFGGRFYEPAPGRNAYAGVSLNYRY
ncbi:MAG: TonB-dependent receptor [Gammaproteobacteria bacterium]|nr:TonB-dependent receptor [Gammaproteobacteria bacterium]